MWNSVIQISFCWQSIILLTLTLDATLEQLSDNETVQKGIINNSMALLTIIYNHSLLINVAIFSNVKIVSAMLIDISFFYNIHATRCLNCIHFFNLEYIYNDLINKSEKCNFSLDISL